MGPKPDASANHDNSSHEKNGNVPRRGHWQPRLLESNNDGKPPCSFAVALGQTLKSASANDAAIGLLVFPAFIHLKPVG
jgi:hypothetical protein